MTSAATRSRTWLAVFVFLASSGDLPGALPPGSNAVASALPMAGMAHFSLPLFHFFPSRRQPSPPAEEEEEEIVSLRGPVVTLGDEEGDEEEAYNPLDDLYFTQLVQDSNHGLDKSRRYRFRVRRKRFAGEDLLEEPRLLQPAEEKQEGEDPEALHPEERLRMVKKALGFWLTLVHLNPERKTHAAALVRANPELGASAGSSRGVGAAGQSWASSSSAGKGMKRRPRPLGMPMRWGR